MQREEHFFRGGEPPAQIPGVLKHKLDINNVTTSGLDSRFKDLSFKDSRFIDLFLFYRFVFVLKI